jgi:hypothetical protein
MGQLRLVNGQIREDHAPLHAEFYEHAKRVAIDKWIPVINVRLKSPKYRDSHSRIATDEDKLEYPDAWKKFQAGDEQQTNGTPLGQLPANKTAFSMELKARGIDTVELLAALPEAPADYMEPMWKQAKKFVQLSEADDA